MEVVRRPALLGVLGLAAALLLSFPPSLAAAGSEARPVITVLDFKGSGVSREEIEVFVDYLTGQIVETAVYRVIDRAQRDLLLLEQQFSASDCTDEKCQLQVGKLLAANQIVVGSLGKVGTRFLLNVKLIDVQTGETIRSASEKYDSLDGLIDDSERLAKVFAAEGGPEAAVATAPKPADTKGPAAPAQIAAAPAAAPPAPPPAAAAPSAPPPPVQPAAAAPSTPVPAAGPAEPEGLKTPSTGEAAATTAAPMRPERHGLAIELQGGGIAAAGQGWGELGGAVVYQFNNRFSLGAWGGHLGTPVPSLGVRLVFGNKIDGLALVVDLGIFPGVGVCYRGFFAILEAIAIPELGFGLRAGYSIFLGKR